MMTQKIFLCSGSKNILPLFTANTSQSLELEINALFFFTFFFFLLLLGNGLLAKQKPCIDHLDRGTALFWDIAFSCHKLHFKANED